MSPDEFSKVKEGDIIFYLGEYNMAVKSGGELALISSTLKVRGVARILKFSKYDILKSHLAEYSASRAFMRDVIDHIKHTRRFADESERLIKVAWGKREADSDK